MRLTTFLAIGLAMSVAAVGCRKKPVGVENIPNQPIADVPDVQTMPPVTDPFANQMPGTGDVTETPMHPMGNPADRQSWKNDADIFKIHTVHFGFDSSAIGSDEKSKVSAGADYLKTHAQDAVRVEGHCDERGTEEYNRALGERRAQAIRDELIRLGIDAGRVDTLSFGEDRPVNPSHNDEAWRQNRRGEFILLSPPQ